jgi:hypothetical protein
MWGFACGFTAVEVLLSGVISWKLPEIQKHSGAEMSNGGGRSAGIGLWGFGSMVSITLSWSVNHSILWMIVHGICSWFYVIYYAVMK